MFMIIRIAKSITSNKICYYVDFVHKRVCNYFLSTAFVNDDAR